MLTEEERTVFDQWEKELEGKEITIPDLKNFLERQQALALTQFENYENPKEKDLYLKVYSRICRQIILFIETPEKVKRIREDAIKEEIKTKK